tara:strand:- start:1156 stop:2202 length:1047 start_codon:yes stop_codon:yes gene_type:complete
MALDFPASPSNGQVFSSGGVSWTFDGEKWKISSSGIEPVFISSSTPTGVAGQIYWDSDESTAYIYYDDGNTAQWVPLVSTAPVSFDTSAIVSGTLPVTRGGTGTTSFDAGKIAEGNTEAEVVDTGSDGHFKVTTEGNERLRIVSSGNVGIGTTSPTSIFDVEIASNTGINFTNVGTAPILDFKANSVETAGRIRLNEANGGGVMQFATKTTGGTVTEAMRVDASQRFLVRRTSSTASGEDIQDSKGGIRAIPQNSQTSAYTLVVDDIGKHVSITTGGVTIPSGVFSAGDAISIYNNSGSDQTITQGASVTLRLAGDGTTGNKTLATYGLCTVLCVASSEFVIAGTGLS